MRSLYIFKLFALVAMLVAVVYLIRHTTADSVQRGFDALGIDTGGSGFHPVQRPSGDQEQTINLCRSRIESIDFRGWHFSEQGGFKKEWVAVKGEKRLVLDYIEIEKWLSQSCRIHGRMEGKDGVRLADVVLIKFVDGTSMQIASDVKNPSIFNIDGQRVASDYLREALHRLLIMVGENS